MVIDYTGNNSVLFHNGSVWHWEKECLDFMLHQSNIRLTGHMNDSRWVAIQTAQQKTIEEAIEFLSKQSGKYLLMRKNLVHLIGGFEESDGIVYSNSSYKVQKTYGFHSWKNQEKAKSYYEKWSASEQKSAKNSAKEDFDYGYDSLGEVWFP